MKNAIRYFGGKGRLSEYIISLMPVHRVYVEPFGGGASVLIRKPIAEREVYNDISHEVVNFFKWLRDDPRRLIRAIHYTPFSRAENIAAWNYAGNDSLELARTFYIRCYQSFGGGGLDRQCGWRFGVKSRRTAITDWNKTAHLWQIAERLRPVQIECGDALKVSVQCDTEDTLHYWDPPYVHSTRPHGENFRGYRYEMTNEQHIKMAETAHGLKGKVIISGYRSDLYEELFGSWRRIDIESRAVNNKKRIECIWVSPNCAAPIQQMLF